MREIAEILLVFLLNLIASTGGPAEPRAEGPLQTDETGLTSAPSDVAPICQSAPILISAPIALERDLGAIADPRAQTDQSLHSAIRRVRKRTQTISRHPDTL